MAFVVTKEVNIDLLQDISSGGTSPSSSSSVSSSPSSLSLSARTQVPSDADHPLPLTRENLSEHCRQFDTHGSNRGDDGGSSDLLAALRIFGVDDDLPPGLLDKMTTDTELKSMTPMERFLAEESDGYKAPANEDEAAITELDKGSSD